MTTLRTAAQQALGFVTSEAWGTTPYMDVRVYEDAARLRDVLQAALRAALAQQDEPVAWLQPKTVGGYSRPDLGYETCSKDDYGAFPVYHAPPQRKPLTEEVAALTAQRDALLGALKDIAGTDPVDAALDPQRAVRIARAATKAVEETK